MSDDRPAVSAAFRTVIVISRIVSPVDPDQYVAHFKEGPNQYDVAQRSTKAKALGMLARNFPRDLGLRPEALYLKGHAQHIGEMLLDNLDRHGIEIEEKTLTLKAKEGDAQ